jgi:hypothetical protein
MATATKLGDIGLVGFAVFVATALVAVTLGAPALSESTPTSAESPAAASDHGHEGTQADGADGPADAGPANDHVAAEHHHDDDTAEASAQPGAAQDEGHDHGGEAPSATPLAAEQHGHDADQAHESDHSSGHAGSARGQGDHSHGESSEHAEPDDAHDAHEDHADEHGHDAHTDDDHEGHDGHGGHDDHEAHDGHDAQDHDEEDGHAGHDDEGDHDHGDGHDHANMYAGCDDGHPETQRLRAEVQHSLTHLYPDPATLIAQGYIPYFDAQIPGGLATEGIGHWLNPEYIDNGAELDPTRPESILTDEWYRPIGVMFIENNDGQDPTPVYVNDDGTPCSPWHPHTDMPARIGWWYYRQVHDGAAYNDGEVAPDEETLAMMHMWAVDNPYGVYAAHDYPPAESRQGFPPPRAGYDTPATPLDDQAPDPEDPDTYPFDAADTCPHCPDSPEADPDGHGDHDGQEGHEPQEHDEHDGHAGHGDDEDGHDHGDGHDHANMYAGCDDDHPESVALRGAVSDSLSSLYTDVATLVAKGYVPYPDIILPGITHWLKPPQIYDERVMDPLAPEAVLTDVWHRPVGMMFVEHPDEPAPAVYVNDDGTECYPWHPHTDAPAVFAWNAAELVYQQNPEYEDVTPAMMHVWVDNPHGMYAAHDYPPPSDPPGPLPSYLADTSVQDALDDAFGNEESKPVFEALYELFARIEEGVLEFNGEPPELPTD